MKYMSPFLNVKYNINTNLFSWRIHKCKLYFHIHMILASLIGIHVTRQLSFCAFLKNAFIFHGIDFSSSSKSYYKEMQYTPLRNTCFRYRKCVLNTHMEIFDDMRDMSKITVDLWTCLYCPWTDFFKLRHLIVLTLDSGIKLGLRF